MNNSSSTIGKSLWRSTAIRLSTWCTAVLILLAGSVMGQTTLSSNAAGIPDNNGVGGDGGVTFVLDNTSGGDIVLTDVTTQMGAGLTATYSLWASTTSLSGSLSGNWPAQWTQVASGSPVTSVAAGQYSVMSGIGLTTVLSGATVRYVLRSSNGIRYTTYPAGAAPNTFSGGGVSLLIGDAQIAGSNVGYGGTETQPFTNTPRGLNGSITFAPSGDCDAPTAVSASGVTTTAANINFTPASGSSVNFYVEYGPQGTFTPGTGTTAGGGTLVTGTSSPIALSGLTSGTVYDVFIREDCGVGPLLANRNINFTTICTNTTVPYSQNFNATVPPATPPCMSKVDIHSANTWTTGAAPAGFSGNVAQYVGDATAADNWLFARGLNLTIGTTYTLLYRYGNDNSAYTEDLFIGLGSVPTPSSATANPLMTHAISSGAGVSNNGSLTFTPSTTGTYYIGFRAFSPGSQGTIYLDNIYVAVTPSCVAVTAPGVTNITGTSADVTFTCTSCTGPYIVEWGLPGFTPGNGAAAGDGTIVNGAISPINITGLAGITDYEVYVRQNCGGAAGISFNNGPVAFQTGCTALNLPYFEDYTSYADASLPLCYVVDDGGSAGGLNVWQVDAFLSGTGYGSGGNHMEVYANQTGDDWFFIPEFNMTAGTTYQLSFYYGQSSTSTTATYSTPLEVAYGTSQTVAAMTTTLFTTTLVNGSTDGQLYYGTFSPATTGVYTVGFKVSSTADLHYIQIDDIGLKAITCPQVDLGSATTSNVTTNSVDVSWACTACTGSFIIEYGNPGFTPGTGETQAAASSPATLTGLTDNTSYDIYVIQDCGGGDLSDATFAGSITTLCSPADVPYFDDFSSYPDNITPACYTVFDGGSNTSGGIYNWATDNFLTGNASTYGSGGNHMEVYGNQTGEDWFWIQEMNLTGGTSYRVNFFYGQSNTTAANQHNLIVAYGAAPDTMNMNDTIADINLVSGSTDGTYGSYDFTPAATGVYSIGFGVNRASTNTAYVQIDDVEVVETPTCERIDIASLSVSGTTASEATVEWVCTACIGTYIMEYGAPGFTPGTGATAGAGGTVITAASSPGTLTGLSSQTSYEVYVRQDCGAGDISLNRGPVAFVTACGAFTAPFHEGFDVSSTSPPLCWTASLDAGSGWEFDGPTGFNGACGAPGNGSTGTGSFALVDYSTPTEVNVILNMPLIDVSALTVPQMTFDRFMCATTNAPNPLFVEYFDGAAWQLLSSFTTATAAAGAGAAGWQAETVNLTAAVSGGIVQLRFRAEDGGGPSSFNGDMGLDEIDVDEAPSCLAIDGGSLVLDNPTASSIDASWLCTGCTGTFGVIYGPTGFDPVSAGTTIDPAASGLTISGLTDNTTYDVYVYQDCGTEVSDTTGGTSITTLCAPTNVPYSENFDTYPDNVTPDCYTVFDGGSNMSGGIYNWATDNFLTGTGYGSSAVNHMEVYGNQTGEDWFWIQDLNLTGGQAYRITFYYGQSNTTATNEHNLIVAYGASPDTMSMNDTIADIDLIPGSTNGYFAEYNFTPATTGVTSIGFGVNRTSTNFAYVQIDDITVIESPTCDYPHAVTASPLAISADIAWDCAGCVGTFTVEYGAAGFTIGTGTQVVGATSPETLTGLTSNTAYDAYVWQDCGGGDISDTIQVSFATGPSCGDPFYDNGGAAGQYTANSDEVTTICPINPGELAVVTFSSFQTETNYDGVFVFNGPDTMLTNSPLFPGTPGSTFGTPMTTYTAIHQGFAFRGDPLVPAPGPFTSTHATGCLTFHFVSDGSGQRDGWDAIVSCISCAPAENPAIGAIASNGADVSWDCTSPACTGTFMLEYGAAGFTPGTGTLINPAVSVESLSGLTPATAYDVLLWQDCGGGDNSDTTLLNFTTAPACEFVTVLTGTPTSGATADISWDCFGCTGTFELEYGAPGFTPGTGTTVAPVTSPETISGLSPITSYEVRVWQNCGAANSDTTSTTFTTPCASFLPPVCEDFNGGALPNCWSLFNTGAASWLFTGTVDASCSQVTGQASGNFARIDFSGTDDVNTQLISPIYDVSALTTPFLKFAYYQGSCITIPNELYVEAFDGATWQTVATLFGTTGPDYIQYGYDLSAYTFGGGSVQVRFRAESGGDGNDFDGDISLDDVCVEEAPTCLPVASHSAGNETTTTVDVSWVCVGCPGTFGVIYGPTGFDPAAAGTTVAPATSPETIGGLSPNTEYDFYVYQDCGGGDISDTTSAATVRTLCAPEVLPYFDDFSAYPDNITPPCYAVFDGGSNTSGGIYNWATDIFLTGTASTYGSGVEHMEVYGNQTGEDWFWLPEMTFAAGTSYRVQFYYGQSNTTATNQHNLIVAYGAGADTMSMNDTIADIDLVAGSTDGNFAQYDFIAANSGVQRIGFGVNRTSTNTAYVQIDDVSVSLSPSCEPVDVGSVAITGINGSGANVDFVCSGCTGTFIVEVGAVGFTPGTGATAGGGVIFTGASSPIAISGLTAQTDYDVYVRQDCSGDFSPNDGPNSFQTACATFTAPLYEAFDADVNATPPACWSTSLTTGSGWDFDGPTGFNTSCGAPGDGSTGTGAFAWIDFSGGNDVGVILEAPLVDMSATTAPRLRFDRFMCATTNAVNPLTVEYYDGAAWQVLADFTTATAAAGAGAAGWQNEIVSLTPALVGGIVQIRFRGEDGGGPSSFNGDIGLDEVYFEDTPTCPQVDAGSVVASGVTNNSANVDWVCTGCLGTYIVEYGLSGFTPGTGATAGAGGTVINPAISPTALSGLTSQSGYDVYVRQDCGVLDGIGPNTGTSFTTACDALPAPFCEGFDVPDASGNPPTCWSSSLTAGSGWEFDGPTSFNTACGSPGAGSTGTGSFAMIDYSTPTEVNVILNMPLIDVTALTVPQLYFDRFMCATSNAPNPLFVEYYNGAAWVLLDAFTTATAGSGAGAAGWKAESVNLSPAVSAGIVQIRFRAEDGGGPSSFNGDMGLDEICVDEGPTCPNPAAFAAANVVATSADLTWNCAGCLGTANLEYGAAGFTLGTGTLSSPAISPTSVTGLTSNTSYDAYLWVDCGLGDMSDTLFLSFTTPPGCGDSWYDNGGAAANYNANSDEVTTFCPDSPGDLVIMSFSTFRTEAAYDGIFVFDGPDTMLANSPLIPGNPGTTTGAAMTNFTAVHGGFAHRGGTSTVDLSPLPGPFVSSHPSGCLTYHFVSDGSVQYPGWEASIACGKVNFTCADADTLLCGQSKSGIVGSSNSLPPSACPFNGAASTGGSWYLYQALANEDVTASTCGGTFDSRISIFEAAPDCSNMICVAMNDDVAGCTSGSSEVTFAATLGTDYYIVVHGAGGSTGGFNLSVICSPSCTPTAGNMDCGNAASVAPVFADGSGVPTSQDNTCAYTDAPTTCSGTEAVQGLWYTFNTGTSTRFQLTLLTNDEDASYTSTAVSYALYSGACSGLGAAGELICVDDAAGLTQLPILTTGTDYTLVVYNHGGVGIQGTYGMLLEYLAEYDAGIESILAPTDPVCGTEYQPVVILKNFGAEPLTSVTIEWYIDAGTPMSYNWTGFLSLNQSTGVALPNTVTPPGFHTLYVNTVNPNGFADQIPANDQNSVFYNAAGQPIQVHIVSDGKGAETTWEIYDSFFLLTANGGPYPNNVDVTESFCLSTDFGNCYSMFIYDSFGDGMCCGFGMGSWEILDPQDRVILKDDGVFTFQSPALSPASPSYFSHEFCLPLGPSAPLPAECGVFTNNLLNRVYCNPISGVSTYQFEFSNPNAGFIRRIALPTNSVRFSQMQTNPLTPGTTYFCRVKADQGFIGSLFDDNFGPGCEMALDPNQVPGCTQLIDNIGAPTHSCGVTKQFGGSDKIWAVPVVGATQYRFRFVNASENYARNIVRSSYVCLVRWFTNPLSVGVTYDVTVEVFVNGTWSGFCGNSCQVTIAPNASALTARDLTTTDAEILLWPNPASDHVQLLINDITDMEQRISVDVYDMFGKKVITQQFGNSGDVFNTILDLDDNIASGMYMVNITINDRVYVERLSVQ